MAQLFGELYEAGGQQVEAFFWLNKAAAIAQAIADGAAAVISAYAGPYAGPVLAALTAAMWLAFRLGKLWPSNLRKRERWLLVV